MEKTVFIKTPLGILGITEADGFVKELFFAEDDIKETVAGQRTPLLEKAKKQILEYLEGTRKTFDLPLAAQGTKFQKTVWEALRNIPYGETRSYKQVAQMIGKPNAYRAVGMANNKNPILILTPCHRVIGSNGKLVGYAAGLEIKEKLLMLERTYADL